MGCQLKGKKNIGHEHREEEHKFKDIGQHEAGPVLQLMVGYPKNQEERWGRGGLFFLIFGFKDGYCILAYANRETGVINTLNLKASKVSILRTICRTQRL
jgi:hypothetical protein